MAGGADFDIDDEGDWDDDPLPPEVHRDGTPRLAGSLMLFIGALAFFAVSLWARMGSPPFEIFVLVGMWIFLATAVKIAEVSPWV